MKLKVNENIFKIKIASTPREREIGMMNQSFNDSFDGMLFIQNNGYHCFWMKNCIINLDIIFIQDNTIVKIFHNCEKCGKQCEEHFCYEGNFVLELEGGKCKELGIKEGDLISLV